jgi:hypothetical protein
MMNFNKVIKLCISGVLMCSLNESFAQEKYVPVVFKSTKDHGNEPVPKEKYNTEVPRDIIILKSTKDYKAALKMAKQAARRLHKDLDLRGLSPNKKLGLTLSKDECHGGGGSDDYGYPCYLPRGDGNAENDDYVSIEYSNAYKGFGKGYYIVVAALSDVNSAAMKTQLAQINKIYPDAYAKRTFIWFGCMH